MNKGYKHIQVKEVQRDMLHCFPRLKSFDFKEIQDAHLCGVCKLLIAAPDKLVLLLQNAGYNVPNDKPWPWLKSNVSQAAKTLAIRLVEPSDMFDIVQLYPHSSQQPY